MLSERECVVRKGKKDQDPDGRLEASSFITKVRCGQRQGQAAKKKKEKTRQGKLPGVHLGGRRAEAKSGPRWGWWMAVDGPAAEARQTSLGMHHGRGCGHAGAGSHWMEALATLAPAESHTIKRVAWWRFLLAVFILICRMDGRQRGDGKMRLTQGKRGDEKQH